MKIIKTLLILLPILAFSDSFLVFGGKTGWIGQKIVLLLQEQNHTAYISEARLECREAIIREIERYHPDFIINAAGMTGRPNIDWCESHQQETLRGNVLGVLNIADIAYLYGIHLTNFGTGCIYNYDEAHPMYSGIGFTEEDEPNFTGSFYSMSKAMLDKLLQSYPNVLNLRLRMPISSELCHRNLISKLINYRRVVNIPNSMTVLEDLLPIAIDMTVRKRTGNYNFTNPGTLSHNELLALYKEYINPAFTWENFTLEEQNQILKAHRSNNELDVSKLLSEYPNLPPIQQSIRNVLKKMGESLLR